MENFPRCFYASVKPASAFRVRAVTMDLISFFEAAAAQCPCRWSRRGSRPRRVQKLVQGGVGTGFSQLGFRPPARPAEQPNPVVPLLAQGAGTGQRDWDGTPGLGRDSGIGTGLRDWDGTPGLGRDSGTGTGHWTGTLPGSLAQYQKSEACQPKILKFGRLSGEQLAVPCEYDEGGLHRRH
jgi:hypothetical protein